MKYLKKNKIKIDSVDKHLKELMKNPEFKKEYLKEKQYLKINALVIKSNAGNVEATEQLIKLFYRFICKVANKYAKKEPGLPIKDLEQHGVYVFLTLCKKYNPRLRDFVGYIKACYEHTFTDLMCKI